MGRQKAAERAGFREGERTQAALPLRDTTMYLNYRLSPSPPSPL